MNLDGQHHNCAPINVSAEVRFRGSLNFLLYGTDHTFSLTMRISVSWSHSDARRASEPRGPQARTHTPPLISPDDVTLSGKGRWCGARLFLRLLRLTAN